jgi:hypothetical protein
VLTVYKLAAFELTLNKLICQMNESAAGEGCGK